MGISEKLPSFQGLRRWRYAATLLLSRTVELQGAHGTCRSRATKIEEEGFACSPKGRAGKGVYFWEYGSAKADARDLAVAWWRAARRQNTYRGESNDACSVIYAKATVKEVEILNLENLRLKESIAKLISSFLGDPRDEELVSATYAVFISELELENSVVYKVMQACLPPPSKHPYSRGKYLGHPRCLIVRHPGCLAILAHEEIEDD